MLKIKDLLLITIILGLATNLCYAETIYKSVDNKGNITFSDKPIPGAKQEEKLTITPPDPEKEQQQVRQLEQKLSKDKPTSYGKRNSSSTTAKRQRLQHKLKLAYTTLEVSKAALAKAQKEANAQFSACVKKAAAVAQTNASVICKASDLTRLQALVAEAQAKVDNIKTELDSLPR